MNGAVPVKKHELKKIVKKCTDFKSKDDCENAFGVSQLVKILNYKDMLEIIESVFVL